MSAIFLGCGLISAAGVTVLLLRRWPDLADRVYATLIVAGALPGIWGAVAVLRGGPPDMAVFSGSLPDSFNH